MAALSRPILVACAVSALLHLVVIDYWRGQRTGGVRKDESARLDVRVVRAEPGSPPEANPLQQGGSRLVKAEAGTQSAQPRASSASTQGPPGAASSRPASLADTGVPGTAGGAKGLPARSALEGYAAYRLDLLTAMGVIEGALAAGRLKLVVGPGGECLQLDVLDWLHDTQPEESRARLLESLRRAVGMTPVPAPLQGQVFELELRIE